MKTILFIEDDPDFQDYYLSRFKDSTLVLQAETFNEAEQLFFSNPNIDIIVMDGCLNTMSILNTLPLIGKIRETYKGFILASSSDEHYREAMVKAGCNVGVTKGEVASILRKCIS